MGGVGSLNRCFAEVETKTAWKAGLVVDVVGGHTFIVDSIVPTIDKSLSGVVVHGNKCIKYYYSGSSIISETKADVYEITLRIVGVDVVTGGANEDNEDKDDLESIEDNDEKNIEKINKEVEVDKELIDEVDDILTKDEEEQAEDEDILNNEEKPNFTIGSDKYEIKCGPCSQTNDSKNEDSDEDNIV